MTDGTPAGSRTFDANAEGYERTIAQTLLPVVRRVVDGAALQPGEAVLDVGTGTGTAASFALGDGRSVVGIDGSPAMLELARRRVAGATFTRMDFSRLDFADASFDVVIASHSLLFAEDRVAALREWLRVARPGGRLSLSVPGPEEVTPTQLYRAIYERNGISTAGRYPERHAVRADVEAAGWTDARASADPTVTIRLAGEALLREWRTLGARGEATRAWTPEQHEALTAEMLAATPRTADGTFVMPFGALFVTARRPA
ncbi:MAG: methyltransferase domain-containing protein [Chloroflexota bacterium]